ncbi:MAG: DUF1464 family protein [Candidatus Bathyarchaeota archaeon]|nr:DUF1464 family protein [Candidatus Bathyarchaeota archaeon]
MVKAVGIDSGTKTMDIFGFDDKDGSVIIDIAIPRDEITKSAKLVVEKLREVQNTFGKIDAIVASSGYGMQLKKAQQATNEEIAEATFVTEADVKRRLKIIGLRELMQLLKGAEDLNSWFTQGAIHLTTVPKYRKANKIDMGTSDKVYSAILAVKDQAERLQIPYDKTNLILVEVGFAYTSAIAVKNGKIVDAMAGTAGFPSFLGMGFLDSEVAYAVANSVDDFSKMLLFAGGAASVGKIDSSKPLEEFVESAKTNSDAKEAYELMLESLVKDVASLLTSVKPQEIILSGRFVKIPEFLAALKGRLFEFFEQTGLKVDVVVLGGTAQVGKQASEGAAVFANGLAGGKYKPLIDTMKLTESEGTVFSNLYLGDEIAKKLEQFKKL